MKGYQRIVIIARPDGACNSYAHLHSYTRASAHDDPVHLGPGGRFGAELDGEAQWARENDQRITKVGRLLRKTHLDEFPQFINVLKGEMSLVGPRSERPSLVNNLQKEVPFYRARLLVRPGVTGWAQINYGYPETIEETIDKLEYDLYYIKNRTILLDLRIILSTPATIFGFKGK